MLTRDQRVQVLPESVVVCNHSLVLLLNLSPLMYWLKQMMSARKDRTLLRMYHTFKSFGPSRYILVCDKNSL